MFNKDLILINQLLLTIEKILKYSGNFENSNDFVADNKTFDATLMNFIVLGETVGKISNQFRNIHNNIEWRMVYAFRNIIAHDYFGIDEEEVFEIIKKHLPKLKIDLMKLIN